MHLQSLKVLDITTRNATDGWADRWTDARTDDGLWYEINIPYFSNENNQLGVLFVSIIMFTFD